MRAKNDLIILNGIQLPIPDAGYDITESTNVDGGRNANGAVVGQIVGRNIWKINNLQWSSLTVQEWTEIKEALKPFYVPVTFYTDTNERITITMYPGDRNAIPLKVNPSSLQYEKFANCKFNLIDCGL